MTEIPLRNGRTTEGVVRVGKSVRRPAGPHSAFVARLLDHLKNAGFEAAPRSLGTDECGRDVLDFIEGDVPADLGWYDDAALGAAAGLIRRYHDATVTFLQPSRPLTSCAEIVCHNDLSPCNFVFRNAIPCAIIDFDAAAPGSRAEDLGYAAWLWLDIGNAAVDAEEQRRRLRLFTDAYQAQLPQRAVRDAMISRQERLVDEGRRIGHEAMARWASDSLRWTRSNL